MLIATLFYRKFESSIQLQLEESVAKFNESRKIFYFVSVEAIDTAIYLQQWVLSFTNFCRTPFLPNITESKNGLHVADDLRRNPETAPSNPV